MQQNSGLPKAGLLPEVKDSVMAELAQGCAGHLTKLHGEREEEWEGESKTQSGSSKSSC